MNRRDNPYTPGAGRQPPILAGREGEVKRFRDLVERVATGEFDRSLIFSGLRGVGKTVLLIEMNLVANEAGWITSDVQEVGAQPDFRVSFGRMALRLLQEVAPSEKLRTRLQRALGVVKSFSVSTPVGGVQLQIDANPVKGTADTGDPEQDMMDLLVEIGSVALDAGTGALFLVDEMQNLASNALAAVALAFQRVSREKLPVALVGAGLPDLPKRLFEAKPYADRLFEYFELGQLSEHASKQALVEPCQVKGVSYGRDVAKRVAKLADHYPYFLQEYGRELWDHAAGREITNADVDAVEPIVKEGLARTFYGPRFALATDTEQRYLAAMAAANRLPVSSAEVSEAFGAKSIRHVSPYRDALIQKGLVWVPRRGQLDFTVPLFGDFLRANHPLPSFYPQ